MSTSVPIINIIEIDVAIDYCARETHSTRGAKTTQPQRLLCLCPTIGFPQEQTQLTAVCVSLLHLVLLLYF